MLFHNHPAKSVAYCMGLVRDLEGRGGQVGCGTSQLGRGDWHGPAMKLLGRLFAHNFDLFCSGVSHLVGSRFRS